MTVYWSVPVIRHLAERLQMHRLRQKNTDKRPDIRHKQGGSREHEQHSESAHSSCPESVRGLPQVGRRMRSESAHKHERDASLPGWRGWHACRRGLNSNLYRLGVPDVVIQRILRQANLTTTTGCYIATAAPDFRNAMMKLEQSIPETDLNTNWSPAEASTRPN
jgi:integrase